MNVALFDFGGTGTTRETFGGVIRNAGTPRQRVLGAPLFAPMLAGCELGLGSGSRPRRAVAPFGFRDVPARADDERGSSISPPAPLRCACGDIREEGAMLALAQRRWFRGGKRPERRDRAERPQQSPAMSAYRDFTG
jgi:hypothetical protein